MADKNSLAALFGDRLPTTVWEGLQLERALARLSLDAVDIADASGLSRRELARRMGTRSPSTVQRIVGAEAYNVTVETLMRFAHACGYRLSVKFTPIARPDRRRELRLVDGEGAGAAGDLDLAA